MGKSYIVHFQNEDGSFYTIEVYGESVHEVYMMYPDAYMIDEA